MLSVENCVRFEKAADQRSKTIKSKVKPYLVPASPENVIGRVEANASCVRAVPLGQNRVIGILEDGQGNAIGVFSSEVANS